MIDALGNKHIGWALQGWNLLGEPLGTGQFQDFSGMHRLSRLAFGHGVARNLGGKATQKGGGHHFGGHNLGSWFNTFNQALGANRGFTHNALTPKGAKFRVAQGYSWGNWQGDPTGGFALSIGEQLREAFIGGPSTSHLGKPAQRFWHRTPLETRATWGRAFISGTHVH